jgi:outer membrane protein TolC
MVPCKRVIFAATCFSGLLLSLAACAGKRPQPPSDPIAETLQEIEAYRGEGGFRSLDHAFSDDPVYQALGDRPTTAAVQFSGPICRINLSDVLLTTLKNNRSIRIEDYNRSIAEDGIEAAKGIYDLLISASYEYSKSETQDPRRVNPDSPRNSLSTSKQRQYTLGLSLQQLVPTGGVLSFFASQLHRKSEGFTSSLFEDVNPYDSLAFGVSFVQPLLRGFGPYITNAPIRIAGLQEKIARENFRNQVIAQLVNSLNLYWELVFAIDNYEVNRLSLERARELLRITIIKRDTGVEPPSVVLQAEAEVARREAQAIDARRLIADVSDSLKRSMNITEGSEKWRYNLVPVDRPLVTPVSLNDEAVFAEALQFRPDYRGALLTTEIAEIDRRVKKNARLPQLNAQGTYQITGLDSSTHQAFDNVETADFEGYRAGLEFSYPLQNRQARAAYRQSGSRLEQARETITNLEDIIRLEVQTTLRALETNLKLTKAFEASIEAEKAKLESQKKRYDVGLATIFEVLEFQEDLAVAERNYIRTVIDYNKAMIELQRVKASFLQDYRVEFLDEPVARRGDAAAETGAAGK